MEALHEAVYSSQLGDGGGGMAVHEITGITGNKYLVIMSLGTECGGYAVIVFTTHHILLVCTEAMQCYHVA